jgi:hypothetical protein
VGDHWLSKKRLFTALRWISVVPAAIIFGSAASFVASLLFMLRALMVDYSPPPIPSAGSPYFWFLAVETPLANALWGAASVWAASVVAPSHKEGAAIGIGTLISLYAVAMIVALIEGSTYLITIYDLSIIAGAVGMVVYLTKFSTVKTTLKFP